MPDDSIGTSRDDGLASGDFDCRSGKSILPNYEEVNDDNDRDNAEKWGDRRKALLCRRPLSSWTSAQTPLKEFLIIDRHPDGNERQRRHGRSEKHPSLPIVERPRWKKDKDKECDATGERDSEGS